MKYDKINQEVLKRMLKEKRVDYAEDEEYVYILNESVSAAYKIRKCLWYISFEGKLNCRLKKLENIPSFMLKIPDTEILEITSKLAVSKDGKLTARILKNKADDNIYVDVKLLDYFDIAYSTLRGTGSKNIIYVFEDETFVGCVLPVNPDSF